MAVTREHRSPIPVAHGEHRHAAWRAPRTVAVIAYWAPVVLWLGYEIRWRWRRLKARLDLL